MIKSRPPVFPRSIVKIVFGLLILAPVTLGVAFVGSGCRTTTPGAVRRQVAREVPVGSGVERALRFLNSRDIENGGYDKGERIIWAALRNTGYGLGQTTDIEILFYFDEKQRLIRVSVKEETTHL